MSAVPAPQRAPVYLPAATLCSGLVVLFGLRLVHMLQPSGDLRVAAFDAFGVVMALVPTWGFVLWRQRRPLRAAAGWLFGALLALSCLPPLAFFLRP